MELTTRQKEILGYLKLHGDVQIDELATMFSVTTQTVRRDVNVLCEQGLARRVHGGVNLPAALTNTPYQYRAQVESDVKQQLARKVAEEIPDGATVMLGIGTSITYVAQFLTGKNNLRVVTNNIQAARILESNSGIEVFLAGGLVRSEHQDIVGQSVLNFFRGFEADIGIIGCGSVSESLSAMEHEIQEAEISRSILENSRQKWLLADASKWGRFASVKVAAFSSLTRIYTNKSGLPGDLPLFLAE